MKKLAILVTIILTILSLSKSYGQDTLKANNKNFMTELNVNLFQGQLTLNNAINQIKFRYMNSSISALRIGFTINTKRLINNAQTVYGTNPYNNKEKQTSTMIGINFGTEKHFTGTKRLSPYIGWELALGYKWSKDVIENSSGTTTIEGAWQQYQTSQYNSGAYYTTSTVNGERGYFSYGLNFITGFDFYMAKHLFIGYEIQFGFTNKAYSTIDVTSNGTSSTSMPDIESKEFSIGPNIINGIRIGYVF